MLFLSAILRTQGSRTEPQLLHGPTCTVTFLRLPFILEINGQNAVFRVTIDAGAAHSRGETPMWSCDSSNKESIRRSCGRTRPWRAKLRAARSRSSSAFCGRTGMSCSSVKRPRLFIGVGCAGVEEFGRNPPLPAHEFGAEGVQRQQPFGTRPRRRRRPGIAPRPSTRSPNRGWAWSCTWSYAR